MCRFALYLGSPLRLRLVVTAPSNSIIHQSLHSQEGLHTVNGDGFGVAWYAPEVDSEPGLFKAISPAWNNLNLAHLTRITRSRCILAHVRAATAGLPVAQLNCHPFSSGRLSFMHNGVVAGFHDLRRGLLDSLSDEAFSAIHGSTDSEVAFAVFLDRYRDCAEPAPEERLATALVETIDVLEEMRRQAGIEDASFLNLAVSDGDCAVVSRYQSHDAGLAHSLYFAKGGRYFCEGDSCRMEPAYGDDRAVIIASEPLNDGPSWHHVPGNHLVVVSAEQEVELRPIA